MRLRGITLANFKSFAHETEIPLGRITSLVGPNGAGKSNALYGLQKVAAIMSGGQYQPAKSDYFDDNDAAEMRLGATLGLSDAERRALLDRAKSGILDRVPDRPVTAALFRHARYMASFKGGALHRQEVCLPAPSGKFYTFARATTKDDTCDVELRDPDSAYMENMIIPSPLSDERTKQPPPAELFGMLDPPLSRAVQDLFGGLSTVPAGRAMPPTVPVRQSGDLTPDGQNLPNELNDLRRAEQTEFDKHMARVTRGDPSGVEPRTVGSDLVLEVRERGLSRRSVHTDLGSGQRQTLILGWQMFRGRGTICVVEEPELHLHAERQRSILRTIRDKCEADGTQFVIETHSPVFLGGGPDERVVLVTKDTGRSHATEIVPDNVGLIRREMGITHADALHPTNILFVEGRSDLVSFRPFLGAAAPGHASSTMIYSLDGAYNVKNLGMLIRYLEAEGRRMFAILDDDDEARRLVEKLEGDGLLDGNFYFLEKNIEDEFDDDLIVGAARRMAAEAGCGFSLTAAKLRASRDKGEAVATTLKKHWSTKKCGRFSKVRLAEHVVGLAGGRVPPGIGAALRAAAAYFEAGDGRGGGSDTRGRDARKGGRS